MIEISYQPDVLFATPFRDKKVAESIVNMFNALEDGVANIEEETFIDGTLYSVAIFKEAWKMPYFVKIEYIDMTLKHLELD